MNKIILFLIFPIALVKSFFLPSYTRNQVSFQLLARNKLIPMGEQVPDPRRKTVSSGDVQTFSTILNDITEALRILSNSN